MNRKDLERAVNLLLSLETAGMTTISEARVLFAAAEAPANLSVRELKDRTGLPFSTVSRVAYKLLLGGWFKYRDDPRDRRRKIISANLDRLA